MLLEGIFLPLTTPFHPDGRLFLHKLGLNVEHYSRTQAAGMLVLGQAGEAGGLTDIEVRQVLEKAIEAAGDDKVMIAAVGCDSVAATLALAEVAAELGYDAIAIRTPEFGSDPKMRAELLTYFRAVADTAELPVLLTSELDRRLAVAVLAELAQHSTIIGAFDEDASAAKVAAVLAVTANVSRDVTVTTTFGAVTRRMLGQIESVATENFVSAASLSLGTAVLAPSAPAIKTRTKKVGFQVLAASTSGMLEAWEAGAVGAVPTLGACAPQACCEVWQAFKDGDPALAAEKQHRILTAAALVEGWRGIAALKYGCDLNAYFGGRARLPLLPLSDAERAAVELALAGLKN